MKRIGRQIEDRMQRVALDKRVTLLEETGPAIVVRDASSITSAVPYVRFERGNGSYDGRRRRFRFDGDGGARTVLARIREAPTSMSDRALVARVVDERGVERPVAVADPESSTLHLLLETTGACQVAGRQDGAADAIVERLFSRPLDHLLAADGPPWVGGAVPGLVREMLARRIRGRRPRFEREIAFLRRAGERRALPAPLVRRLELLEGALRGDKMRTVEPEVAERETERLSRLVGSRVCASLRFTPDGVRGLLNPRAVSDEYGHAALMFALQPAPAPGGPRLRMWRAGEPEQGTSRTMCLGRAVTVLTQLEDGRDTYGLVDTIVNFVETNFVGVVPLTGSLTSRHFRSVLENLF